MAAEGPSLSDWLAELRRRKVFRVAAVYGAAGFVLVQATAYLFEALLFPPWAHRLFVVFVLLGFPIALVLAWAFELTPEGMRPTSALGSHGDGTGGPIGRHRTLFVLALVATVGTAVALAGWTAWSGWLAPRSQGPDAVTEPAATERPEARERELPQTRIAVLYFDDFSPDGELAHLANGFTEALIHELAQAEGLDVVSRNGVRPFRGRGVLPDSVAWVLGAGSLVNGSVERYGNELQVTVQLVDGATATHILSERLEGRVDAPLELRNRLVQQVSDLLRRRLGREVRLQEARAETDDPRAWELYYLAGRVRDDADSLRREGDFEGARKIYLEADSLLARAESRDSSWTTATVQRGWVSLALARVGSPVVSEADRRWLRTGIGHADRALTVDPGSPSALEVRGELRYYLARAQQSEAADSTMRSAEADLRRAVSEDPERAAAWSRLAYLYWFQGRFAEARSAVRRSREADRFLLEERDYLYLTASLALDLEELGRADRLTREGMESYPDDPAFLYKRLQYLASTASSPDAVEEAWDVLERFEATTRRLWPPARLLVAAILARSGMADSARAVLARNPVEPGSGTGDPDAWVNAAYAHLQLGNVERTLELLDRYLEARPGQAEYRSREWWWRPLHDDPRFRRLVGVPASELAGTGD